MKIHENNSTNCLPGLVKIRMFLNLSRPGLAKIAGCHPNSLMNIENHARGARLDFAKRLAQALCCKIDDFLTVPTDARLREIKRVYHLKQAEEAGAA